VELIFMPTGETIGTMTYFTDPQNGFRDALMHWVEGGVYPKPFPVIGQDSLTLTGDLMPVMTKLPRVAPAGLMRYRGTTFGDDFDGNLFSAEFNTGRIMRHRLSADGATYQTTDEVFMRSDSLDSHPTDVLEDADGSLLVVTTGGWFIAGCPLSVVAKADIEGGLFRIRKKDVSEVTDARGQGINFKSASATALTDLLSDTRPFVKDKAIEELVLRGNASVAALNQVLDSSDNQEARASAVFALYRIQTGDAMRAVSSALDDKSLLVRTAAARAVGLARDTSAVDKLITMVEHDSPPVRRQGATALGQIGDTGAVKALVAASATARDRFVEHAIRYALITLGKSEPLLAALKDPSERVRQTALVALDQMDGSPLVKGHVVPFLQSEDPAMQKTGVWVLSHHADWSDVAVAYLKRKLRMHAASDDAMVSDLMVRFMSDPSLQNFVIDAMRNAATPAETRLFLLNVVAKGAGHDLPERWLKLLEHLLRQGDDEMRLAVLDMLQSRSIRGLESQLVEMSADARLTIPVRLKALGAHIASHPELSGQSFGFLMQCMRPENDPPARQAAVRLLAQAKLNDRQLLVVANDLLANADAFILPGLVNCFEGNSNEAVGEAFVDALSASSSGLGNLSAEDLQAIISGFSPAVRSSAAPLLKALAEQQASRLSELRNLQAGLKGGDVREGRKLFYSKAMCYTCHSVTGEGGTFGPDLTNIGEIRSEHDILEAILYPSASFAREYEPSKVSTTTANYSGIIKQEIGDVIVMETGPGTSVRIPRKDVLAIEPGNVSMMPPGLNKQLTQAELTDLIAYLTTLPDGMGRLKRL
jgi:putative heme-binding domain-containing protein